MSQGNAAVIYLDQYRAGAFTQYFQSLSSENTQRLETISESLASVYLAYNDFIAF